MCFMCYLCYISCLVQCMWITSPTLKIDVENDICALAGLDAQGRN